MSAPMELSPQIGSEAEASTANGPSESLSSSLSSNEKVLVSVEICLNPSSAAKTEDVRAAVERMLEKRSLSYTDGPIPVPMDDLFLSENVQRICICGKDDGEDNRGILLFWQVQPVVHVYQLIEDGPGEDISGGDLSSFREWFLPAREFDGLWESLVYETGLKQRLLRYTASALLFTEKGVNPCLVSWNRIILLHGPPGTGKTSLCKALAQKLSIRLNNRYSQSQLVEINAHSLFSKWFSESGKLVGKLFEKIQEMVDEESNLVFVLIDEVESLAAARKAALSGSEPSDSIRVVNALLTQLDRLKSWPNVIILTTSNITAAIDVAFVDRADIKAYVGPPTLQARYEILRSCLQELIRSGIVLHPQDQDQLILPSFASLQGCLNDPKMPDRTNQLNLSEHLLDAAKVCEGLSGRALRKLPFLAHAALLNPHICDSAKFVGMLIEAGRREISELTN
ncbi:pachytene checkpoint protein 2 homolog isoform X1 [Amborella trichopoda]|uniref:Pachytene checkpoint protein 2 homolog n=1 Tax=Amborella trichopoda TaxID=13333 RepID=W1PZK8_AMBTC|nr:pachytene checkpoint protein 2 homolog isoform X1 [Amborella trichopoda]ERN13833.1 hypothetical protein AMTR_s00049p00222420 [Amborella trichopoda]|eukprot:XP_006852366.1 pachytene checkpoint protein 2 homolog isoform X1 [Amborella trichopoda]